MFQRPSPSISLQQHDEPTSSSHDDIETVVGPSVHVEGDFSSEGNILVKGMVSGNVKTSRLLTVEPGAKITANVKASNAVISGEIKGNVRVLERLDLTETARISGDIFCKVLSVEAGALVVGKVTMDGIAGMTHSGTESRRTSRVRRRVTKEEKEFSSEDDSSEDMEDVTEE